jgi:hypothetical protein
LAEKQPLVSIIIPVYNGSDYLGEAINSALAQTYKNIEIIVINDGSNDGGKTEKVAKSFGDRIRYISKENGGVASALNAGIKASRGEYISWLSHDDMYDTNKIEVQINFLVNKGYQNVVIFSDYEIIDDKSVHIRTQSIDPKFLKSIYLTILSTSINGCSMLIPRDCFMIAGNFNETLKTVQDNEMWLRIASKNIKFEYLPVSLIKSRVHPNQTSVKISDFHQKEKDVFYLWAIDIIQGEVKIIFNELEDIVLSKKCFNAHRELMKKCGSGERKLKRVNSIFKHLAARCGLLDIALKAQIAFNFSPTENSKFTTSSDYWETRYANGCCSGGGSYGKLAIYKANIINSFVKKYSIQSVIELGCGDGNQLSYYVFSRYIGIDVSETAITLCKNKFKEDKTKEFHLYSHFFNEMEKQKAELSLSIDVLYHLVEEEVFSSYINNLFRCSDKFVIIYSTNFSKKQDAKHHVDREIVSYIEKTIVDFKLIEQIENHYKGPETMSDFFIYKKIEA